MSSANRWHDNPEMLPLLKQLMLETMRERAKNVNWSEIPVEEVYPGITRQVVHGERQTLVRYVYQPGSVFPQHHHPQEQVTSVLSGRIEFDVAGTIAWQRMGFQKASMSELSNVIADLLGVPPVDILTGSENAPAWVPG